MVIPQLPADGDLTNLAGLANFLGATDQAKYLASLKTEVSRIHQARQDLAAEVTAAKDLLSTAAAKDAEWKQNGASLASREQKLVENHKALDERQKAIAAAERTAAATVKAAEERATALDADSAKKNAAAQQTMETANAALEDAKAKQAEAVAKLAKLREVVVA